MKRSIAFLSMAAVLTLSAQTTPDKTDKSAKKPAPSIVIPKDAVRNADGTFSATDSRGDKWRYSNTPFGVSRTPDTGTPEAPAPVKLPPGAIKATVKGDTVLFETPTPFGPKRWEKKKSELSDFERSVVEDQTKTEPKPSNPE